ncbi:MAG: peptide-methionine (S)-S-oxide reductase MsrA [Kiritimatiellae bacterium]|nr:peptide-methionine (S)-S-oxide reductase MsrA [Kiritimatiellia bacterium]
MNAAKAVGLGLWVAVAQAAEERPMSAASSTGATARAEVATFAGGCFWCIEEIFRQTPGVLRVVSGYTGGTTTNPTYREVCSGRTGHAEAVQITYDPAKVRYEDLLEVFWRAHDPTQLNRQGNDVGTQYRSAIFVHDERQRAAAEASKAALQASGRFDRPVVTTIEPAGPFYPAEEYHQQYYRRNRDAPYCRFVIRPKLNKLGLQE